MRLLNFFLFFFFFNDPATTEIYTFPYTTLFRTPLSRLPWRRSPPPGGSPAPACLRMRDRKSTRLNSSHLGISYAVFCLKKKTKSHATPTTSTQATTKRPQNLLPSSNRLFNNTSC